MGRPQTPIPLPARPFLRAIRLSMIPAVVLGLIIAGVAWSSGNPEFAVLVIVVLSLVEVSLLLVPRRFSSVPALVGIALLTWSVRSILPGGFLPIALVILVAAVLLVSTASRRLPRDATPGNVRRVHDDAVGQGATAVVRQFEELGYRQVGALSFRTMGFDIIESLMIGPNRDRFAEVTDAVVNVVSPFGHRALLTRNSGMTAVPPHALVNDLRGADPRELDGAHDRALAEVSRWAHPDPIDAEGFVDRAVEEEQRALAWARTQGRKLVASKSGLGSGPLWERSDREAAIIAWLESEPPRSES